jgi:tetratricopeptide (TPR) repeat protein
MKKTLEIVTMSIFSFFSLGVNSQDAKIAGSLFKTGDFIGSQKAYKEILITSPNDLKSLVYMGYTSLLFNQLDESEKWFNKVKEIKPNLPTLNYFMSEIYHRQLQFSKAATLYRASGREAMAKKMEYFSIVQPYQMDSSFNETSIKFIVTDPLPIVEVIINNDCKGYFIIDTGGGELILSEDFAKKTEVSSFGVEKGSGFGGAKKAPMGHGAINSIKIGELQVKNIPIVTLNLNQLELGGYKIDGIIGTVFLYQFLSTIDYKNGLFLLRNKARYNFDKIIKNWPTCKIIPFVLVDDHYMMAKGNVNNSDTMLLFVDTGLAGNAFTCPKSTLKKNELEYNKMKKSQGLGGGGYFNTYPMEINSICLGDICVKKLHGVFGAFPKQIENSFGFKIDGLISHEFFRNYSLTIEFESMQFIVCE